jgi:hypothetical protein
MSITLSETRNQEVLDEIECELDSYLAKGIEPLCWLNNCRTLSANVLKGI